MEVKIKKLSPEEYFHKLDLEILSPIEKTKGTDDVKKWFVKLWPKVRQQTIALCGSNFHVTQGSSPELYKLTESIASTLSVDSKLYFYVEEGYHINSYTLKDKEASYVVLTTGAVDRLSKDELKFLIGHELGHLISGHVDYHLLLAFLPESTRDILRAIEVGQKLTKKGFEKIKGIFTKSNEPTSDEKEPTKTKEIIEVASGLSRLNEWNRISEYTADRVGLLACQDINVALSALMKISGLPQSYYSDASVDEFVKQANEFKETYGGNYDSLLKDLDVLDEDHPWLIRRASILLDWYNSGEYNKLIDSSAL